MPKKSKSIDDPLEITFDNDDNNIDDNEEWDGEKLSLREQILLRPDTQLGNVFCAERDEWVVENKKIIRKKIQGNEGLERIFYEISSNIIDNIARSREKGVKLDKIKFTFINTSITAFNNGYTIPCKKFKDKKTGQTTDLYNVEEAFGNLAVSSNYDDSKKRTGIVGRNGFGSKLTNMFSKKFSVRTYDKKSNMLYEQTWKNNMSVKKSPKITESPKLSKDEKNGFTEITFEPDFERFGMKEFTPDILSLFTRYVYDCAMNTGLPVELDVNGEKEKISIKSLTEYVKLFVGLEETKEILKLNTENSEVILAPTLNGELTVISFVNSGYTPEGGIHVDKWLESTLRPIVNAINSKGTTKKKKDEEKKKGKKKEKKTKERYKINIKDVKNHFTFFIKCNLVNPAYSTQTKTKLVRTESDIKADITEKEIKKLMKWEFVKKIEDYIRMKEFGELKKTEGKKRGIIADERHTRANFAGKKQGCILILCEGKSAQEFANHGIRLGLFDKTGRDYIGTFTLMGKILNCRGATPTQVMRNKTVVSLIQALGLKYDIDYTDETNFKTLNYSKVVCFTDQDSDGRHISGLVKNMFDVLFPSLLKTDFFYNGETPIIKIDKKGKTKMYYDLNNANRYIEQNNIENKYVKYAKGIAGWSNQEVPEIFGKTLIKFVPDKQYKESMDDAFNKKKADKRKEMINNYDDSSNSTYIEKGNEYKELNIKNVNITDFIYNELIKFFIDDLRRMIPNLYDGLKESQRKILYMMYKRKLYNNKKPIKVAQLGASVAEHTGYRHGEGNLFDTIARMCQDYPGTNNIALFTQDGQFGSRYTSEPGESRYIFTRMSKLTPLIFREEDFKIIKWLCDEGKMIEPEFYIPILPMILINGCRAGIGVGWSSSIPCYNPVNIIDWIKRWLNDNKFNIKNDEKKEDDDNISFVDENTLLPWYRGFKGEIGIDDSGKIYNRGIIIPGKKDGEYRITEIPINMLIESFDLKLDQMVANKELKSKKNNSSEKDINSIDFTVVAQEDGITPSIKTLGLESKISTSNMTLFTKNYKIHQYKNVDNILDEFCRTRYEYYTKRKDYLLKDLNEQLKYVSNRYRFAKEVKDDELVLKGRNKKDVIKEMEEKGYDKKLEVKKKVKDEDENKEEKDSRMGYAYLFNMKIISVTNELLAKLLKEKGNIEDKITELKNTTEKDIWLRELDEFLTEYNKVYKVDKKKK